MADLNTLICRGMSWSAEFPVPSLSTWAVAVFQTRNLCILICLQMMIWMLFQYQLQPNLWIPNVGFKKKKKKSILKFIFCFSPRPQRYWVGSSICTIVAPAADLDYASWMLWTRWLLPLLPPQEHQLWGFLHCPLQAGLQWLSWRGARPDLKAECLC